MSTARGFLGEGDVLFDVWDDDTQTWWNSWKPMGESSKFAIGAQSELKEKESRGRGTRGQLIASVALLKSPEIEIVLDEVNADNIKLAFMGRRASLTQGSGSIADQVITAKLGHWIPLGLRNFATAAFTVKSSDGVTTYVLGTDYEVNYRLGMVRPLASGAIADAASLKVSGTYSAVSGSTVKGATKAQLRARLLLDGRNLVDGSDAECEVWEAILAPEGEFDFKAEDFGSITLKGKLVTPAGKTSPFEVRFPELT